MRLDEFCRRTLVGAFFCFPLASICAKEPGLDRGTEPEIVSPTGKVTLRQGEFRLLKSGSRVVRVTTSDAAVCSAVSYEGRTLAIWGRASGTSDITIWLADRSSSPVVWVVNVAE
jgi:hypothetical protein